MEVVEGNGPAPLFVLSLIEGLDQESMFFAELSGGREFRGWTEDRSLLAAIYDALNTNTIATGQWKKNKVPDIPAYARPGSAERDGQTGNKKVTVKDLYKHFQRK